MEVLLLNNYPLVQGQYEQLDIMASCYEKQFIYPGRIRNYPHVISGDKLYGLLNNSDAISDCTVGGFRNKYVSLSKFLTNRGSSSIERRFPLLAYGANRNAENLVWKLKMHNIQGPVVALPAFIFDADVVAANVFFSGHFYADLLFNDPIVEGTKVEAIVLLINEQQLYAIHRTEEVPPQKILESGTDFIGAKLACFNNVMVPLISKEPIETLGYVSWSTIWAPEGSPIAYNDILAQNRSLEVLNQKEMLEKLCRYYLPDENGIQLIKRFQEHWDIARKGKKEGAHKITWYQDLVKQVKDNGYKFKNGNFRTGTKSAEDAGMLVKPKDTWSIPNKYLLGNQLLKAFV